MNICHQTTTTTTTGVDVAMSIVDVTAPDGSLVPGVARRLVVKFKLLNNNEPDLNNDVASIDQATDDGINFNFASYIVDVNLTASDVANNQLTTVTEQLTADLQTTVNSVESAEFTVELTVHNNYDCLSGVFRNFYNCSIS